MQSTTSKEQLLGDVWRNVARLTETRGAPTSQDDYVKSIKLQQVSTYYRRDKSVNRSRGLRVEYARIAVSCFVRYIRVPTKMAFEALAEGFLVLRYGIAWKLDCGRVYSVTLDCHEAPGGSVRRNLWAKKTKS